MSWNRLAWDLRLPRRYRVGKTDAGPGRRLLTAALICAALCLALVEHGLSGLSPELTEEAARHYLLTEINRAVEESLAGREESYVSLTLREGQVTAVSADAAALSALKLDLTECLAHRLEGRATAWVSLGSLTGFDLLSGRGPRVPVRIDLAASADVGFTTGFVSAGLNQSCHRVLMTVSARAYSPGRRYAGTVEVETTAVLAETAIVGQVPGAALLDGAG